MTHSRFCRSVAIAVVVALGLGTANPVSAQSDDATDPVGIIISLSRHVDLVENIETIGRISEEITFWQGVALMGDTFEWQFSYNAGGTNLYDWTLRLDNVLGDSELEAVRAVQAANRNPEATPEDRENIDALVERHQRLRALARQIYDHLHADENETAQTLYQAEVIPLRRDIANRVYSAGEGVRDRIARMALDARLGARP